jgi:glycosyltransferase involved in cell wall biosynthesis
MDISIIVPFLNEERYIRRCIESLLAQDFDRDRYEVIFVDNGSTDNSARIVEQFENVKLLTESKGQVYTARNTGIGAASGEIIAFTDADCVVSPNWLSSIQDAIVAGGATIVLGSTVFPSPKSALLGIIETYRNDHIEFVIENGIKTHLYAYTNNMAVRAEIFERVGLFAELPVPGDTEIVHRCLRLIPETRLAYRPEMQIEHLELVNLRVLLRKIYLYGQFDRFLDLPDYDEPPRRKTSGAEAHCLKKNAFSLRERFLFQVAVRACNACFLAGQWKGRVLSRFQRRRPAAEPPPGPSRARPGSSRDGRA